MSSHLVHNILGKWGLFVPITGGHTEAQGGEATGLGSHSRVLT